jgi:hypothetical protein
VADIRQLQSGFRFEIAGTLARSPQPRYCRFQAAAAASAGIGQARFKNQSRRSTVDETTKETSCPANRNVLFLIIGALVVGIGVLGYNLYQTKKEPTGLQINLGPDGLKVQNK